MADFMISYSSSDRPAASALIEFLREQRKTLWLDEAPDLAKEDLVGVPGGQEHWRTISTAIDEASAFLVLETPAWQASAYCRKELDYARAVGKRVVVAVPDGVRSQLTDTAATGPLDDLSWVLPALQPGDDVAAAHARLVRDMSSGRSKQKVSGFGREAVGDAMLVSTSPTSDLGLHITPEMIAYCQRIFHRRRGLRRVMVATATVVLLLLALLGTATVLASRRAQQNNTAAEQAQNRSLALLTAQRADQAVTTHDRLALAQQALSYADTPATRAILARIQQTAAYLTTVQTPAEPTRFAAVSDDGRTVLIAGANSLLAISPTAGTFKRADVPEGLGHRVTMSADGRTAYAVTAAGNLLCIDVPSATVRRSPLQKVVDVSLAGHETLYVLTRDARLSTMSGCDAAPTVVGSGFNNVQTMTVDTADHLLLTLTTDDHVFAYSLPHGPPTALPQVQWSIGLLTVRLSQGGDGDAPNAKVLGHITVCGHTIHVVAGVTYALPSSTHVAISTTGSVIGSRTSNLVMNAVGCGPDGTAWAAPWITSHPIGLSDRGYYPLGVVDSRDRGSENTVAASPNGAWGIVAHADGRVDVIETSTAPWSQSVGKAVIAVPLDDGVVTGDAVGNIEFRTKSTTVSLGKVDGQPIPWTVALQSKVIVAAGRTVYRIDHTGVHPLWSAAVAVTSMSSGSAGADLVVKTDSGITAVPINGARPMPLTVPALRRGELYFTVALDGKAVLWITSYGRLILTDTSGKTTVSVNTYVAGQILAAFRPDHGIVAIGGDGVFRTYSAELKPTGSTMFGSAGAVLHLTPDGRIAILGTNHYSVWAIDTTTLAVIAKVQDQSTDMRLIVPAADGRTVDTLITSNDTHQLEQLRLPSSAAAQPPSPAQPSGSTEGRSPDPAVSAAPPPGSTDPSTTPTATSASSSTPSTELGPDGLGPFHLGMTIAEAQKAYPALEVTKPANAAPKSCSSAPYLHDELVFGTKGTLVFVRQGDHPIPAANGLKVGDTLAKVRSLYPDAKPSQDDPNLVIPTAPGSKFSYWIDLRFNPNFDDPDFQIPDTATIVSLDLNFNQDCFD